MGPTIEKEEGDVSKGFAESAHVIEGEVQAGGQLHFYMETQSVLVVPKDGNDSKSMLPLKIRLAPRYSTTTAGQTIKTPKCHI